MTKLLLLHLSDIHINTWRNPVEQKRTKIRDAMRCLDADIDDCVLVVSGDIAFSGQSQEYESAYFFLESLREEIAEVLERVTKVHLVMVPGNHDCYLPDDQKKSIRNMIIDGITADNTKLDKDVIAECVKPQGQFFNLMFNVLASDGPRSEDVTDINFNYYLDVAGKSVLIQCFNTAWMVRRDVNQEGNLLFPVHAILKPKKNDYDLVVSVFHHPYNWMQNENARTFKRLIHETSDIALTGHEHEIERTSVVTGHNERIQYFEGGVLQNSYDDRQSTFNAITIDFGRGTPMQKVTHFVWDVDYYNKSSAKQERVQKGVELLGERGSTQLTKSRRLAF